MKKTTTTPATPSVKETLIEVKAWRGSQGVFCQRIMKLGDYKVKIFVERDSYAMQSKAVGYVFHPESLNWNPIYSIPYPQIQVNESYVHTRDTVTESMFTKDIDVIVKGLKSILF